MYSLNLTCVRLLELTESLLKCLYSFIPAWLAIIEEFFKANQSIGSCLQGPSWAGGCFTQKASQKQDIWHYRGLESGLFRSSFSKWGCLDFILWLGFSHCDQTGSNPHPATYHFSTTVPKTSRPTSFRKSSSIVYI